VDRRLEIGCLQGQMPHCRDYSRGHVTPLQSHGTNAAVIFIIVYFSASSAL
jgi:hypothetical protein